MATSEANKRASIKYMQNNLEEIRFRVRKGVKDEIKAFANSRGQSMRCFIINAINEKIERESQST